MGTKLAYSLNAVSAFANLFVAGLRVHQHRWIEAGASVVLAVFGFGAILILNATRRMQRESIANNEAARTYYERSTRLWNQMTEGEKI